MKKVKHKHQKPKDSMTLHLPYWLASYLCTRGYIQLKFEYLSTRLKWSLLNEFGRVPTTKEIALMGERRLLQIPNLGRGTIREVKLWLKSNKLELAE